MRPRALVRPSLAVFALLTVAAPASAAVTGVEPASGTIGTEITIRGSGLAPSGKKPRAALLLDGRKARGTKLRVTSAVDSAVGAFVVKAKAGTYDVQVKPKGGDPMTLADAFEVCLVENVVATPQGASPGDTVTLCAACMPTKPGKIRVGGKKAKRVAWEPGPTAPCSPQGSIQIVVPDLPDGEHDVEIRTVVGTTTVPGGVRVGGPDLPNEDQILQATIDGAPFESTPPRLLVTYNSLGNVFSIFAQSDTAGDNRTLQIAILFDPDTNSGGVFRVLPQLSAITFVPSSGGTQYVLDVDPMTLVASGVVEVTGNTLGKISGNFNADLIPAGPAGAGVSIRSGVFTVRETPVGTP